ncbi:MAG: hydrogen peroxide-dependent heme synthase [Candidatus Nanopelagicales bacterium]
MSEAPVRRPTARDINDSIRYTCWSVFRRGRSPEPDAASRLTATIAQLADADVTVRGLYDVSVMRADADLMVWLHGPTAESVQAGVRAIRRDGLCGSAELAWSGVGIHRPAEFNKGHVPAFMAGLPAQAWLVAYPFVRSYEWYLLPEPERRAMLVEHGMMGRQYSQVLTNTVAAFALGDYEWILALEGPMLHDIVDLMRHLRASQARRHVREETPFFTGRLVDPEAAIEVLR